ncbi:MAG: hypothetical protein JNM18_06485 [Planctomycetaceae bacterium]|nr:hypothetical protein [Planctomycetaceae bacterium]
MAVELAVPTPSRRVILLGASNVTIAFRTILTTLGQMWPEPLEVMTALGHGRSLGMRSQVLFRSLPSLLSCGLWNDLQRQPSLPTRALLTDVGNDILYHVPVRQIVDWAEQIFDRLRSFQAEITLIRPPVADLERLSAARFYCFRTLFMPLCRLSRDEVVRRALELDERLAVLGRQMGVTLIAPRPEWYGLDPLHIRRRQRVAAWREMLAHWSATPIEWDTVEVPARRCRRWELLAPHERSLFGIARHSEQPAVRFADGTRVSVY